MYCWNCKEGLTKANLHEAEHGGNFLLCKCGATTTFNCSEDKIPDAPKAKAKKAVKA